MTAKFLFDVGDYVVYPKHGVVQTTSVGLDVNRKLLIIPTSETGSSSLEESTIFDLDSIFIDPNIDMFKNSSLNLSENKETF